MPGEVLYGRDHELEAIDGALDAVARGGMRLLTVRGEAGIGKSRLLAELRDRASAQGFVVLEGRASELEREIPLVPIVDAFTDGLPGRDALESLGAGQLGLLAGSFPAIEASDDGDAPVAERWRLYRALADLLALIGDERPLLLVVDDIHWADPGTAEFLSHLLRRPPPVSLLVALGLRPGEAAEQILAARRSGGAFDHIPLELGPLARDAAEPILSGLATDADREHAFTRSGGNPLLLLELMRAGNPGSVPGEVAAAVRARIDALSADAGALLEAGAVVGDPWDVDIAKAMASLDDGAATAALDQLEQHALITRTDVPRHFAFRHPIVRSAMLDALGAGAILDAHAAAARELGRAGAPPLERAPHLARAATPGDTEAAAALLEAATAVRARAPGTAADWTIAALRADPGSAAIEDLPETLIEAGRLEEALEVVDSAGETDDPRLAAAGAGIERLLGRHEASRRRLLRALEVAEEGGPQAARVTADLAAGAYLRGDYAETLQWADQAASLPDDVHVADAARATLMAVGNVHAGGAQADRDRLAEAALAAIAAAGEDELAAGAELGTAVSWGLLALERLTDGLTVAREFAAAARSRGAGVAAMPHDLAAALALGLLGRIPEAEVVAEDAEQAARLSGNAQLTQWSLWLHGWVLLEGGELDAALAAAEESAELASSLDDSASGVVARAVLGAVLGARGDHTRARELVAAYDIDKGWICRWSPILVEIDLAMEDHDAARTHAARATELAPGTGMATAAAAAERAEALVLLVADQAPERAAELARRAARRAQDAGAMLEFARDRLLAGRALLATDRDAAIVELTAAAKQAATCGGRRVEAEAVRALRGAGVRIGRGGSRASGGEGLSALSDREREVSSLVAEGLTNREIGARLFLSEKTIETHLTHVFQKLGLRSRAQLAARVGEEGFDDPLE